MNGGLPTQCDTRRCFSKHFPGAPWNWQPDRPDPVPAVPVVKPAQVKVVPAPQVETAAIDLVGKNQGLTMVNFIQSMF